VCSSLGAWSGSGPVVADRCRDARVVGRCSSVGRRGNAQACRELGGSGWVARRRAVGAAQPRWGRLPRARAAVLLGSDGVQERAGGGEERDRERERERVVQQGGGGGSKWMPGARLG
jgi:hypothetical protein